MVGAASVVSDASRIGYSLRPSRLIATASNARELRTVGVSPVAGVGFCGAFAPGSPIGACSSLPVRSTWSRNGPNSSPIQNVPSGALQ
jgi:hypothetical protein